MCSRPAHTVPEIPNEQSQWRQQASRLQHWSVAFSSASVMLDGVKNPVEFFFWPLYTIFSTLPLYEMIFSYSSLTDLETHEPFSCRLFNLKWLNSHSKRTTDKTVSRSLRPSSSFFPLSLEKYKVYKVITVPKGIFISFYNSRGASYPWTNKIYCEQCNNKYHLASSNSISFHWFSQMNGGRFMEPGADTPPVSSTRGLKQTGSQPFWFKWSGLTFSG